MRVSQKKTKRAVDTGMWTSNERCNDIAEYLHRSLSCYYYSHKPKVLLCLTSCLSKLKICLRHVTPQNTAAVHRWVHRWIDDSAKNETRKRRSVRGAYKEKFEGKKKHLREINLIVSLFSSLNCVFFHLISYFIMLLLIFYALQRLETHFSEKFSFFSSLSTLSTANPQRRRRCRRCTNNARFSK